MELEKHKHLKKNNMPISYFENYEIKEINISNLKFLLKRRPLTFKILIPKNKTSHRKRTLQTIFQEINYMIEEIADNTIIGVRKDIFLLDFNIKKCLQQYQIYMNYQL